MFRQIAFCLKLLSTTSAWHASNSARAVCEQKSLRRWVSLSASCGEVGLEPCSRLAFTPVVALPLLTAVPLTRPKIAISNNRQMGQTVRCDGLRNFVLLK